MLSSDGVKSGNTLAMSCFSSSCCLRNSVTLSMTFYLLLVQTKHLKQLGLVALKRFVGLHKIFGILGYSYAYGTNEQHDEEENEEIVVQNSVACGC